MPADPGRLIRWRAPENRHGHSQSGGSRQDRELLTVCEQTGMVFRRSICSPIRPFWKTSLKAPFRYGAYLFWNRPLPPWYCLKRWAYRTKKTDIHPRFRPDSNNGRLLRGHCRESRSSCSSTRLPLRLTPNRSARYLKVIRDLLQDNRTMIIVTHNLLFAQKVDEYIAFGDGGKLTPTVRRRRFLAAKPLHEPKNLSRQCYHKLIAIYDSAKCRVKLQGFYFGLGSSFVLTADSFFAPNRVNFLLHSLKESDTIKHIIHIKLV